MISCKRNASKSPETPQNLPARIVHGRRSTCAFPATTRRPARAWASRTSVVAPVSHGGRDDDALARQPRLGISDSPNSVSGTKRLFERYIGSQSSFDLVSIFLTGVILMLVHQSRKRNLLSCEVVFQREGFDVETLYWAGSKAEVRELAQEIAFKGGADTYRIVEFSPTVSGHAGASINIAGNALGLILPRKEMEHKVGRRGTNLPPRWDGAIQSMRASG